MTTNVAGHDLAAVLEKQFPQQVVGSDSTAVWIITESLVEVLAYLQNDPTQTFEQLSSISAVDYVEYFELVYHLTSLTRNARTVIKARVYGRDEPTVPSITNLWLGADLQEREIYDLMGIVFAGHGNLKRILLWEGFQGHPLRRDYLEPPLPYTWPHGG